MEKRAFDIKIETIGITLEKSKYRPDNQVHIESYVSKENRTIGQSYMTSDTPYWLIYRDSFF